MTETLYELRHEDGDWFYCPNGHKQHFTKKENLEKRLEKAEARAKTAEELLSEKQIELRKLKCDLLAYQNEAPKGFLQKIGLK